MQTVDKDTLLALNHTSSRSLVSITLTKIETRLTRSTLPLLGKFLGKRHKQKQETLLRKKYINLSNLN